MDDLWQRSFGNTVEDTDFGQVEVAFIAASGKEVACAEEQIILKLNLLEVADCIASLLDESKIVFLSMSIATIQGLLGGEKTMVRVVDKNRLGYDPDYSEEIPQKEAATFNVTIMGVRAIVKAIHTGLCKKLKSLSLAKIHWWFREEGRLNCREVFLPPLTSTLHPEFYPAIEGGPYQLIKDYLASDASILMVAGQPGTGKTTLLRHMIGENQLQAHVVYDESLMGDDALFQKFLFGEGDLLIIEDADTILGDRASEKNKLMARFLNVSDGLIKLPNKKLVFTTNLTDFDKVDQALLRPGRCFGVLHTRPLTLTEAQAAARIANKPVPLDRKEYTLAQIFNQDAQQHNIRKIGFAG